MTRTVSRRAALRGAGVVVGVGAVGAAAGCTDGSPTDDGSASPSLPPRHEVVLHDDARVTAVAPGDDPTVAASRGLLARCTAVVVAATASPDAVDVATSLGLPLLVAGAGLAEELERLATRTVVRVTSPQPSADDPPSPLPTDLGDREVVDATAGDLPEVGGLPADVTPAAVVVAHTAGTGVAGALGPLLALGSTSVRALADPDPRRDPATVEVLRGAPDALVLGLGDLTEHFAQRVRTVRRAAELPGGGFLPFPDRRMVALYGHPKATSLGMLGEQEPGAAVARAGTLAKRYAALTDDLVVPAFEVIATVASGSAGTDGTYSNRTPVRVLRPYVDAALEHDLYVVLDLQPGRADFLTQAKEYEELLREPHVGLALDPEWRLGPTEKPLQRIGHVDVTEVNRVGRWLAALVREHDLPPKVLTLHQFRTSMVRDRADLDTGLDEVQWLVHADGQGSQAQKQATWTALKQDLPDGVFLGWKNFEDEDHPMLTPAQTVAQVRPTPSFVSYQ